MNEKLKPDACETRIDQHLISRIADLKQLWDAFLSGVPDPELGTIRDYALGFDYVALGTFNEQAEGYFRYQISWGGPSDEFRFFVDDAFTPIRIEYWFLDWFDGAHRVVDRKASPVLDCLWLWLSESGLVASSYREAQS